MFSISLYVVWMLSDVFYALAVLFKHLTYFVMCFRLESSM